MSRLHEDVARSLIGEIVDGGLEEGEWLRSEVGLAEHYGVSRGVVRETILSLRMRGVIDVRHGRGQQVQPEDDWNVLDDEVLVAMASSPRRHSLVLELLECRRTVEAEAAALAAERATDADVAALQTALDEMREVAKSPPLTAIVDAPQVRAEIAFHDALVAATGNRPLRHMLAPVHLGLAAARHARIRGHRKATLEQHERILAAVAAHDAPAARDAIATQAADLERWLGRAD
jgi:DNA-binding FadR family transcriptional regulator